MALRSTVFEFRHLKSAEIHILKEIQRSEFIEKVECLIKEKPIPKGSSIISLAPFLDSDGLLRVVGRISASQKLVGLNVHPIIIPKKCHIATLLTRHFHEKVSHQGKKITEGNIRSLEFWIIGAKRLITSEIRLCVTCRKLRGSFCKQKMTNIPKDRLTPGPPFTFVGVVFKLSQMNFGENGNVSIYPPSKFDESECQTNQV